MHIWLFHKEKAPISVNDHDRRVMLESMEWFDNRELEPNDYQKKFKALHEKKAKLKKEVKPKKDKK